MESKESEDTSIGEDRISTLPDVALLKILSFLSTREASATSVLSRRWRHLFNGVLRLSFDKDPQDITELEASKCMSFIDRRLLNHSMPKIQSFRLRYNRHFDESRVTSWLSMVVNHKVEELDLNFYDWRGLHDVFPVSLFTCKSLAVLKLDMNSVLKLPTYIALPGLKVLHLWNINFKDKYPISHLFSSCPILEELTICGNWMDMRKFRISAPSLKRLEFGRDESWMNPLNDDPKDDLDKCEVILDTPKLEYLVYNATVAKDLTLSSFPALCGATIHIMDDIGAEQSLSEVADVLIKLISGTCSVKYLTLSGRAFEALSHLRNRNLNLPRFLNLLRLEVRDNFLCRTLMDFLEVTPKLQSLIFEGIFEQKVCDKDKGIEESLIDSEGDLILSGVPQCLLSHLTTVEFRNFMGDEWELHVLRVFLKNATVLECITVSPDFLFRDQEKILKIERGLQMVQRASASCVIKFSN